MLWEIQRSLEKVRKEGGGTVGGKYFARQGHRHFRNAALAALTVTGVVTFGLAVQDHLAK